MGAESSSSGHHFNIAKRGNLRVEMGFDYVLSFTGNVVVYSEFESIIEIDIVNEQLLTTMEDNALYGYEIEIALNGCA